jgi:hypothetical protein
MKCPNTLGVGFCAGVVVTAIRPSSDWKGKLNTTDDFIVYAVDTDGADLRKNLKVSVPPKQLAKLKAARLI